MKSSSSSSYLSKQFKFSSLSSRKSKGKDIHIRKRGKLRYEMLLSKIDHLYIGFTPTGYKIFHRWANRNIDFRKKIPIFLSAKRFIHSSIFLATERHDQDEDNYDGFLIEYGRYIKHDDDYEYKVFYPFGSGLRFTEMALKDFKKRMDKANEKTNNIPYIKCKVNSVNIFSNVLLKAFFGNEFNSKNISFFYNVFCNRDEKNKYREIYNKTKYNLLINNCQNFVARIIEASYATIDPTIIYSRKENKIYENKINEDKLSIKKIDYEDLRYYVPQSIFDSLEKNNNIITQRIREGKSEIVETNNFELSDDIDKNNLKEFDLTDSMWSISFQFFGELIENDLEMSNNDIEIFTDN